MGVVSSVDENLACKLPAVLQATKKKKSVVLPLESVWAYSKDERQAYKCVDMLQ